MWGYDGYTFSTWQDFLDFLLNKYGDMYQANLASISWWGCDLNGTYLYVDGIQQLGTEGEALANAGFNEAQQVLNAYAQNPAQFTAETFEQLAQIKQTQQAVIEGTTYTNGAIQLGTAEVQGGQILTTTKPIVTDNGSIFNNPSVMTAEAVEDPLVPGTFSYLATLKALGWLPVPSWVVAVAPLLGVALGVGLYDLNPEFWEKVSRTLLPFCYDDNGVSKMPISVDSDGTVHTPEDAIEALRQLFVEEGVYSSGFEPQPSTDVDNLDYYSYRNFDPDNAGILYNVIESTYDAVIALYGISWKIIKPSELKGYINGQEVQGFELTYGPIATGVPINFDYLLIYAMSNTAVTIVGIIDSFPDTPPISLSRCNQYLGGQYYNYTAHNFYGYSNYAKDRKVRFMTNLSTPSAEGTASLNGLTPSTLDTDSLFSAYLNAISESGVDGATLEPGAKYPSDLTKHLKDEFPDWYADGIDVISNPVATAIEDGVNRWLPLSLSNTNFTNDTDEASSTQTQTDAQEGTNTDSAQLNQLAEALQDLTETLTREGILPVDPVIPSDPSGTTPSPTPPVITGAGSDLIAIYNPTKAQIQAFNQFLWDLDPTNLVNWKKVIANPIEAVISLHMIYVTPVTGETRNIKCGYIETNVGSKIVTNQYVDIDCGIVNIDEYFHNIWDYVATTIEIYLPFVGIVPLHVSDIMNSSIKVRYRVDVYTGACLAQIIVYKGNSWGTLYTYAGNCAVPLPLTSGSFTGVFSTLLSAAGTAVFGGGLAMAAGEMAGSLLKGNVQQNIQRSGSIGSNIGAMGIRTPYVIITRKVPLDAHMYETQYGFPANKTVVLGTVRGYTRVKDIHLSGIPCTDDELEQIERLLKDGVIIN